MKTEVVLKFDSTNQDRNRHISLMKTEVVLKSGSAISAAKSAGFNENRSCIEMSFRTLT